MGKCVICQEPGGVGMGGLLFCRIHAAEAQAWAEALRANGQSVDVARFAAEERRRVATSITLAPAVLARADVIAAERGLSRSRLIEQLIEAL